MQQIGKRLLVLAVSVSLLACALKGVAFADSQDEFRRAEMILLPPEMPILYRTAFAFSYRYP